MNKYFVPPTSICRRRASQKSVRETNLAIIRSTPTKESILGGKHDFTVFNDDSGLETSINPDDGEKTVSCPSYSVVGDMKAHIGTLVFVPR